VKRQFLERAAHFLLSKGETQWVHDEGEVVVGAGIASGTTKGTADEAAYSADDLDIAEGRIFAKKDPRTTLIEAKDLMMDDDCVPITGYHIRLNNKEVTGIGYGAWFAEVEVDLETGELEVLHMVIANDVGQVLHASGAESQQIGGVACIGLGETLTEALYYDKKTGTLLNNNYLDYKMQTSADVPPVNPILVEEWEGAGEYGACGLAESTPAGTAAAVSNAVFNAIGVRVGSVPITPKKILDALKNRDAGKESGL
jgi:xanthine dehydrogenase molybdenum-binding subunit